MENVYFEKKKSFELEKGKPKYRGIYGI